MNLYTITTRHWNWSTQQNGRLSPVHFKTSPLKLRRQIQSTTIYIRQLTIFKNRQVHNLWTKITDCKNKYTTDLWHSLEASLLDPQQKKHETADVPSYICCKIRFAAQNVISRYIILYIIIITKLLLFFCIIFINIHLLIIMFPISDIMSILTVLYLDIYSIHICLLY